LNTPAKVTAFAVAVLIAFGAGAAVGAAVGPIDTGGDDAGHTVVVEGGH